MAVQHPNISCGGFPSDDRYVSKLVEWKYAADEDRSISFVDRIDPDGIFHCRLVHKAATLRRPYVCEDCGKNPCSASCCNAGLDVYTLYIYEYGGKVLLKTTETLVYDHEITNVRNLLLGLWRLFYGLVVMYRNNFYHLDIKPDNIVYQEYPEETVIKYIDFGVSKKGPDIETGRHYYLFDDYVCHSPDAFLTNRSGRDSFDYLVNKYQTNVQKRVMVLNRMSCSDNWTVNYDGEKLLSEMKSTSNKDVYSRIDVFSLGTNIKLLLSVMKDFTGPDLVCRDLLWSLALKMESASILDRISPDDAFKEYISIIQSVYGVDYANKMKHFC